MYIHSKNRRLWHVVEVSVRFDESALVIFNLTFEHIAVEAFERRGRELLLAVEVNQDVHVCRFGDYF